MKKLFVLALLLGTTSAFAQTTTTDVATAKTAVTSQVTALDLSAATLVAQQKSIETDAQMWAHAVNIHNQNYKDFLNNAEVQRLDAQKEIEYTTQLNTMIASYMSRCNRTFNRDTEMGQYQACMNELAQLQPMKAKSDDWNNEVNKFAAIINADQKKASDEAATLDQMQHDLQARIRDNDALGKQYLAKRRVLELEYQSLGQGKGGCIEYMKTHPNAEPETLAEICGAPFDGNQVHDTVIVQVPGLPYPVWKPWNDNDPRWHVEK